MTDDTCSPTRRAIARSGIFVLLICLGLRILGATQSETPIAVAAQISTPGPAAPTIFVRFERLNHCDPAKGQTQLGLYTASDAPCRPTQTVSLTWLQSRLTTHRLLAAGEYLEPALDAKNPACGLTVLSTATGQPAGWVCSDATGLYRIDLSGADPAKRVQLSKGGD